MREKEVLRSEKRFLRGMAGKQALKKRIIKKLQAVLAGAVLLISSGCGRAQAQTELFDLLLHEKAEAVKAEEQDTRETKVILLTHSATGFSTTQKIAGRFKMILEEKSAGLFQVELFPDDTLGHVDDSDKPLINGTVEMRIGPAATDTMTALLWAPTLAEAGLEEIDGLLQQGEVRRMLEEECEAKGTKLLAVFPTHYRVLTSNERIDRMEDFSKLRIRIFSSNAMEGPYWQSLGAQTGVYDIHQVYSALQQGMVNSQENTVPLIVTNSIQQQQKYLICTNHKIYFDCLLVGKQFYESLSEEEKVLLSNAAKEAVTYAREADERELEQCGEALAQSGVQTLKLSEELKTQIREIGRPVVEKALQESLGEEKLGRLIRALEGKSSGMTQQENMIGEHSEDGIFANGRIDEKGK